MNIRNIIFYLMVALIVGLSIYLVYYTKTESYKCLLDATAYAESLVRGNLVPPINYSNLILTP
jgi:hypothetical protein